MAFKMKINPIAFSYYLKTLFFSYYWTDIYNIYFNDILGLINAIFDKNSFVK